MADVRSEWEQVAEKLQGLGLKLKLHFEQASKEGRPEDEDKVKESLRKVGDAVDQTFSALGAASRDDAVREDVKDVGRTVIEALDATFSELGERFRSTVKHPAEDGATEDAATEGSATEGGATESGETSETAAETEPPPTAMESDVPPTETPAAVDAPAAEEPADPGDAPAEEGGEHGSTTGS